MYEYKVVYQRKKYDASFIVRDNNFYGAVVQAASIVLRNRILTVTRVGKV